MSILGTTIEAELRPRINDTAGDAISGVDLLAIIESARRDTILAAQSHIQLVETPLTAGDILVNFSPVVLPLEVYLGTNALKEIQPADQSYIQENWNLAARGLPTSYIRYSGSQVRIFPPVSSDALAGIDTWVVGQEKGLDYEVGDELTVDDGKVGALARFVVVKIGAAGEMLDAELTDSGQGYTVGVHGLTAVSGEGSGCFIGILSLTTLLRCRGFAPGVVLSALGATVIGVSDGYGMSAITCRAEAQYRKARAGHGRNFELYTSLQQEWLGLWLPLMRGDRPTIEVNPK